MKKLYWTIMVSGGLLALAPKLQFGLAILSFGILAPVLFLPTAAYYGLCLLPFEVFQPQPAFRRRFALLSVAILLVLLFAPGLLIRGNQSRMLQQVEALLQRLPSGPIGVLVDEPVHPQSETICNFVCDVLLTSGRAHAVRVTDSRGRSGSKTFSIKKGDECQRLAAGASSPELRLEQFRDGGNCLVSTDKTLEGDIKFEFTSAVFNGGFDTSNQMSISLSEAGIWRVVSDKTKGTFTVPYFPPWIGFSFSGGVPSGGSRFAGTTHGVNENILNMLVGTADAVSISQKRPRVKPDTSQLHATLVSILREKPTGYKVNLEHSELFNQYVNSLELWQGRTEANTSFLKELLRADNLALDTDMQVALSNAPEIIDLAAPQIVSQFVEDCYKSSRSLLLRLSTKALEPFAAQLMDLETSSSSCHQETLIKLSGRLGVDPYSKLAPFAKSTKHHDQKTALKAMCHSAPRWSASLLPLILDDLAPQCVPSGVYNDALMKAEKQMVALQNLGGKTEVDNWLKTCDAASRQFYENKLRQADCE